MADYSEFTQREESAQPRENVCIDAYRVYDSCGDKNCLTDLPVYFTPPAQAMMDKANNVRIKDVDVITVYIDLEPAVFYFCIKIVFCFTAVKMNVFLSRVGRKNVFASALKQKPQQFRFLRVVYSAELILRKNRHSVYGNNGLFAVFLSRDNGNHRCNVRNIVDKCRE